MKLYATVAACLLSLAGTSNATTVTIGLLDISPFPDFQTANTGQTFSGTGFVGEYLDTGDTTRFVHLFGLEGQHSRTNAQVDLAGFAGRVIEAATLSYFIGHNSDQGGVVTITGYASDGTLSFLSAPPSSNLGMATGSTLPDNTVDVTSLVASAAASGSPYLGLFLQDSVYGNWTYTSDNNPYGEHAGPDTAQIRLAVTYADAAPTPVPEPSSITLLGVGVVGVAAARRRRSS